MGSLGALSRLTRGRPHRLPRTLPAQSRGAVARNAGDPQPPGSSSHGVAEEMPGQRRDGRRVAPGPWNEQKEGPSRSVDTG